MESSPNKRQRLSPPGEDYVSLAGADGGEQAQRYGYDNDQSNSSLPTVPRGTQHRSSFTPNARNDPRNAKDRPKSQQALPDSAPWILVKTKYGRRFVHNPKTKESFWRIPPNLLPAVRELDELESQQKEREANARWAEKQLKEMRENSGKAEEVNHAARNASGNRRRRSESLQREDEAAMLAELAAEAERGEMEDVEDVVKEIETMNPVALREGAGYGSDSSYEEVEVTDSEFGDDDEAKAERPANGRETQQQNDGPVEFGEDDIAYQLAAMENSYASGSEEDYDEAADDEEDHEGEDSIGLEDGAALFREMLDEHGISPFTPWEKLLLDESDSGIIMDDRYTALPNMKARKEVWEAWVKDTAARLKDERAKLEQLDPKIPYLAFLADKATPKLYWPEFKRKYRKEVEMNDRKLNDKDRERLYRDHINRLKLPEKTRKADLISLLNSVPLRLLNRESRVDTLPQQVLSHLHYISLSKSTRDETIWQHVAGLPVSAAANGNDDDSQETEVQRAASAKRRVEQQRQEKALAERAQKVDEDRRKAEKEERWARRDLRAEEQELRRAMDVGRGAVPAQLRDG